MTKLGACQMIAEPHVFDVVLYSIKDPPAAQPPIPVKPPMQAQPPMQNGMRASNPAISRPYLTTQTQHAYGGPNSGSNTYLPPQGMSQPAWVPSAPPSAPASRPGSAHSNPAHATPAQQLPAQQVPATSPLAQPPSNYQMPAPAKSPLAQSAPAHQLPAQSTPAQSSPASSAPAQTALVHQSPAQPTTTQATAAQPPQVKQDGNNPQPAPVTQQQPPSAQPAPKPAQDPVIQMLAQRASINPELKVLMKIVASGEASKAQLTVFQGHIDDLTNILARQNGNKSHALQQPSVTPASQPPRPYAQPPAPAPAPNAPVQRPMAQSPRPPAQQPYPSHPTTYPYHAQPQNLPTNPALPPTRPKAPTPPKPPPQLKGICIEFTSPESLGDRYRFPRNSLLSYAPLGRLVTASFLVVRAGDDSRPDFVRTEQYYQPVTVMFSCASARVLEPLARVVASVEEVRAFMEGVMGTARPAPGARLALRVPANNDGGADPADSMAAVVAMPTTTTAERKNSIKHPTPFTRVGAPAKKKADATSEALCQFCFDSLGSDAVLHAGLPVCKSCNMLRLKEQATTRTPLQVRSQVQARGGDGGATGFVGEVAGSASRRGRVSRGPRVLMFAREMLGGLGALSA